MTQGDGDKDNVFPIRHFEQWAGVPFNRIYALTQFKSASHLLKAGMNWPMRQVFACTLRRIEIE
jgi:hypothetical protein